MMRVLCVGGSIVLALAAVLGLPTMRAADGGELPVAKNVGVYKAHCLSCHTSSYVIQLPKTTRDMWESEVKKMVDLYDAKITPENQKLIVDYLMTVRGLPEATSK